MTAADDTSAIYKPGDLVRCDTGGVWQKTSASKWRLISYADGAPPDPMFREVTLNFVPWGAARVKVVDE